MRIGVIGGGAAGTSVLDSLVRECERELPLDITVFEHTGRFGPGRAYQSDTPTALVNQPARTMSVRFGQPDHFVRWLARRDELPADTHFYVPRELFGHYLEDSFQQAVRDGAAQGIRTHLVAEQVVELDDSAGHFAVRTGTGAIHDFDAVLLCTGSSEPVDVYRLSGHPRFLPDPYPLRTTTAGIDPDSSVAILGTGLSAVDVVLDLAHRGHTGPLRMYSRNGILPGVRNPHISVRTQVFTPETIARTGAAEGPLNLEQIGGLIAAELTAQGLDPSHVLRSCRAHPDPVDRLRRHLEAAEQGERWQAVLGEITGLSQIEDSWSHLDDDARRAFQREWQSVAVSLWSPMPLQSARTLTGLVERGRLEILRDIDDITAGPDNSGFHITGGHPDRGGRYSHRADVVVNTVRPPTAAFPLRAADLHRSLIDTGLAVPHPFGGIRVDFATNRLVSDQGRPSPGLYALGQAAVGELHSATSNLSMIARRAEQTARTLLAHGAARARQAHPRAAAAVRA